MGIATPPCVTMAEQPDSCIGLSSGPALTYRVAWRLAAGLMAPGSWSQHEYDTMLSPSASSWCIWCRWAAVPDDEWPQEKEQSATLLADFDPATEWGDRR